MTQVEILGDLQIDPNMSQKSFGKLEDDVPSFYKRLKYPFQISKSSLFAVGSPHTWPSLLASLVWVTELLSYAEKAVSALPLYTSIPWPCYEGKTSQTRLCTVSFHLALSLGLSGLSQQAMTEMKLP